MLGTSNHSEPARWYAIQTKPQQEERAAANLLNGSFDVFLPRARRRVGARRERIEPLFPRYIFMKCDMSVDASTIRYTRGVTKILGTEAGPTPLDDSVITMIRDRMSADGFVELTPSLTQGDRVLISAGPLKGLVGVFLSSTTGAERVGLLLAVASGQFRVVVNSDSIERIAV